MAERISRAENPCTLSLIKIKKKYEIRLIKKIKLYLLVNVSASPAKILGANAGSSS